MLTAEQLAEFKKKKGYDPLDPKHWGLKPKSVKSDAWYGLCHECGTPALPKMTTHNDGGCTDCQKDSVHKS